MPCSAVLQLEKAVQHIASRVDELAIQPEVYGARVEAQLASLAVEQRALQVWLLVTCDVWSEFRIAFHAEHRTMHCRRLAWSTSGLNRLEP